MQHSIRVGIFVFLVLLPRYPVRAQVPVAQPDPAANAALKYWQAFALAPTLDNDQEKILEHWNNVPFDDAALELIDRSRASRESLRRGAKLPRCDWSLDYDEGVRLLLPHLQKSRKLASLAALHARHEFEQGHWHAGWEDVAALLKLGRHLEMEPLFVQRWVGRAIESQGIEAAVPYLPELKSTLLQDKSGVLDEMPAATTLEQVVLKEKQVFLMSTLQQLKQAEQQKKDAWQPLWKGYFEGSSPSSAEDRNAIQSVKTFAQAVKMLEDLLPIYDELAKQATLPWKEFDARYPDFAKKAKTGNPLAEQILPLNEAMVATERRTQTRMALFKAALAVVQGGPERLKDIPDPFGDGPFAYRALDKGFELKSKLLYRGKPETLAVGQKTKD
jgi:hypothetical protein